MATPQIRTRYEDLGLETTSDPDLVDRKTELGYLLEGQLVIFQVIDEPELLKELGLDTLATNKLTVEGKTIISLQKILFEMDPSVLPIVLQQQLDETLFISEGKSASEAHDLANEENASALEKVQQALKRQFVVLKATVKEPLLVRKRPREPTRAKRKRESKHPGKKKLKELIREYQARLSKIAKDLNVSKTTVSRWIGQDSELKKLAEDERKARAKKVKIKKPKVKKPKRPKVPEIKTLDELKALLTSGVIKLITWGDLPIELHKALVQELARECEKKPSKLLERDYREHRLSILNQKTLRGFLSYWYKKNKTDKPVTSFILKELGLKGRREERYERLEELIKKHQARISEIAKGLNVSKTTVSRWINEDSELKKLAEDQRRVRAEEAKIKKSKKPKTSEIKSLEQLKTLMVSGKIRRIFWPQLSLEIHRALVQELAREVKKELLELAQVDYRKFRLGALNQQTLGGFYRYWTNRGIAGKSTCRFILEELGLVTTKIKSFKEIKTIDELKKLFDLGAIKRVSWSRLSKQVQVMLVEELAVLQEKPVEKLIKRDYTEVPFPALGGNTLGGLHLHYFRQNKTGRRTTHFILEELGLMKEGAN